MNQFSHIDTLSDLYTAFKQATKDLRRPAVMQVYNPYMDSVITMKDYTKTDYALEEYEDFKKYEAIRAEYSQHHNLLEALDEMGARP